MKKIYIIWIIIVKDVIYAKYSIYRVSDINLFLIVYVNEVFNTQICSTQNMSKVRTKASQISKERNIDSSSNFLCPGSSDPFYVVSYYIKWVTTSWTHSRKEIN